MAWNCMAGAGVPDTNAFLSCTAQGFGGDTTLIALVILAFVGIIMWKNNFGAPVVLLFGAGILWILSPMNPTVFGGLLLVVVAGLGYFFYKFITSQQV